MPAIVTIGHQKFLLKSESAALAVVKAMAGAIPVQYGWDLTSHAKYFYPDEHAHVVEISVELASQGQIFARKIVEGEDAIEINGKPARLAPVKRRLMLGGGD